ncbi:MAG: nucleotidyltransferase domain-containing protein [bacterium]|nr:nucleotidyltransferase domain-containing protein [bacterium]
MARATTIKLNPETLRVAQQYRRALSAAGIKVENFLVFGSQAKGTAQKSSDIDIAVVSSQFSRDYSSERVRLMRLGDKISLAIEPHPFHPDDLNDRWSTFAQEIKKYGIQVGE